MLELEFITRNKHSVDVVFENSFYVYFLIKEEEIVYVGATIDFVRRLHQHKKNKEFDSFNYIRCSSDEEMNKLELQYIMELKPIYNKQLPIQSRYLPKTKIKNSKQLNEWDFKRLCKNNDIKPFIILGTRSYYDIQEFEEVL